MKDNSILIVGAYPPPYGGIASHLREFIPYLYTNNFREIYVITEGVKNERVREKYAEIYKCRTKKLIYLLFNPLNLFFVIRSLIVLRRYNLCFLESLRTIIWAILIKKYVKKHSIKLVSIMHSWQRGYVIPILKSLQTWSIPIVFTAWGVSKKLEYFRARRNMLQSIIAYSDMIWATSDYCARGVEVVGIDSSKIQTIYLGVDMERFSWRDAKEEVRRKIGLRPKSKIALFVGRMNQEMGLDVILDVIPSIVGGNDDIVFLLAGAASDLSEQAKELERRFPGKVYVRIDVSFEKLTQYYQACDILLAPTKSKHACMGVSIKEAMASGRPAVASNSGGIPEAVIDRETGIMVKIIDEKINNSDFKKAILSLLEDDISRIEMGEKARQRAIEIFANEITCSTLLQSYDKLLSN